MAAFLLDSSREIAEGTTLLHVVVTNPHRRPRSTLAVFYYVLYRISLPAVSSASRLGTNVTVNDSLFNYDYITNYKYPQFALHRVYFQLKKRDQQLSGHWKINHHYVNTKRPIKYTELEGKNCIVRVTSNADTSFKVLPRIERF